MIDLKPCPFCGGDAEAVEGFPKSGYDRVSCTNALCNAEVEGPMDGGVDSSTAAWNTRAAQPDALRAENKRLLDDLNMARRMLNRIEKVYRNQPGFASDIGGNAFDIIQKRLAAPPKETRE